MSIERRRIIALGRVQGVGFRWFVRDVADALGLEGWVRNLPDGRTVETVAQGPPERLDELVAAIRRGPPGSHVSECTESPEESAPGLSGFRIAR